MKNKVNKNMNDSINDTVQSKQETQSKISDEVLFSLFKSGDEKCFEILLERYKRRLFSFIMNFVHSMDVANDIFQEVFYKLIRSSEKFDLNKKLSSWIFRIANNCCIDYLRENKKLKEISFSDTYSTKSLEQKFPASQYSEFWVNIEEKNLNPEEVLIKRESELQLQEAIESLPLEQKQVLLLRVYGDFSFKEISSILNCSQNTALSRMSYAIKNLKKVINYK